MEQKYRTLEVGEMLREGDEYFAVETNLWKPVRNFYPIDFVGFYRRPVAAEETITEVREAWQKDHMEMKRKLDDMTESWYDQRAELADARNKITDLTRRLEDALSDRVIAEGERDGARESLSSTTVAMMKVNSEIYDLKINLDNAMRSMVSMEARISEHHKEADRLTRQNEELSKASYQLNTIKQAFQFIKES